MLRSLGFHLIASTLLSLLGAGAVAGQGVSPSATLTVSGVEQQANGSWDSGYIRIDFNGFVEMVQYAEYSTNASLASAIAAMFVRDYHSFGLYAKAGENLAQPNVVTFQLADGSAFGPLNVVDPSVSFTLASTGFASPSAKSADIGIATLTIGGASVASNYGAGSTAASIAQDLASLAASSFASSVPVTVTSEGPNIYLQAKQATGNYSYSYSLTFSTTQSFSTSSPAAGTLTSSSDVAPITVYSYCVGPVDPCPTSGGSSGYLANGNVHNLNDSVMGNWTYGYDELNRLTSGSSASGPYNGDSTCWSYDSFGNRTSQSVSTTGCGSSPPSTFAATYSANNHISSVTTPTSIIITYDAAGNVTYDGVNTYTYDAEGRVCALNGPQGMIGYQYDANGNRVGKGTVTTISTCDITASGYQPITDYVLDQGGAQMTEMMIFNSVSGTTSTWAHSNVEANGAIIATFDTTGSGLHFYLNDPLGSRRVQTDSAGIPEQICLSLPFGDQLYCTGSASFPTEHHFTGKERDTESGLDYFGARYYASNMGRWISPDWSAKEEPVPYAKLDDPQSLNLYSYVRNNPLSRVDADGHVDWGIQRAWNWLRGRGFKTDAQIQGLSVAQTAHSNLGSLDWMAAPGGTSGRQVFKPGSNKCNEYVGDTLDQSGHKAPMVPDGKGGMRLATAHELADPNMHISGLTDTKPLSQAQPGDVIAQAHGDTEGHTGIIVAPGVTSSANANEGGVITENNWGFRDPNAAVNNGERNGSNSPPPVVRTPIDQPQQ